MGWKCIVPDCKRGYDSDLEHASLFGVPKDDGLRAKWVSVIPMTKIPITSAYSICEEHFLDSDIKRRNFAICWQHCYIWMEYFNKILLILRYYIGAFVFFLS